MVTSVGKDELITEKSKSKPSNISTFNKPVVVPKKPQSPFVPKQIEVSIDGGSAAIQNALNNNTKDARSNRGLFMQQQDAETSMIRRYPRNLPHWIILTGTYSAVFIGILLISRSLPTPDSGKLYIHFTAFWSLLLYFLTDQEVSDYYATDPLDNVVESFIKIDKK